MTQAELLLVDLREQIRAALLAIPYPKPFAVRQHFPREPAQGTVLLYQEYDNHSTACPVVDELCYQIDVYAPDREAVSALSQLVNSSMLTLGLKRVYMGAETLANGVQEHRILRFGRKIDKRFLRLID